MLFFFKLQDRNVTLEDGSRVLSVCERHAYSYHGSSNQTHGTLTGKTSFLFSTIATGNSFSIYVAVHVIELCYGITMY